MSYPYPAIVKPMTIQPATIGDTFVYKQTDKIAYTIDYIRSYLSVETIGEIGGFVYPRQLLAQQNVSVAADFYITNHEQYKGYNYAIIEGGCLCIKFRVGSTVSRYKLLDHNYTTDWSWFPEYEGQVIKKNFCLEFWGDTFSASEGIRGIRQGLLYQMSDLNIPDTVEQEPNYNDILRANLLDLNSLGWVYPETLPHDQSNLAWLDNT